MFDSHTYPKGALVLHMLRSLVGDEPFFKTLSHFLHRYAFDAVDTADFIRSVKTVTGQNLDWFFDQWLFKPGHPVFEVKSVWDAASKVVRLNVAQVQDFSRGVPVFRVPVSIKLVAPGKTDIRKIWIEKREETFEFPLEEKPLLVRFDEDNVLIKEITFPKERDELLYQLGHDDVIGRMDAAAALLAFKDDPRTAAALTRSLQTDPFWAVRKSALEALAQLGVKRGAPVFKKAGQDPDPQVRAAALVALGSLKDPYAPRILQGPVPGGPELPGPGRSPGGDRPNRRSVGRPVSQAGRGRPVLPGHGTKGRRNRLETHREEIADGPGPESGWADLSLRSAAKAVSKSVPYECPVS